MRISDQFLLCLLVLNPAVSKPCFCRFACFFSSHSHCHQPDPVCLLLDFNNECPQEKCGIGKFKCLDILQPWPTAMGAMAAQHHAQLTAPTSSHGVLLWHCPLSPSLSFPSPESSLPRSLPRTFTSLGASTFKSRILIQRNKTQQSRNPFNYRSNEST